MGAGVAYEARRRFPELPTWYGNLCATFREDTPVLPYPFRKLILFPTKPLNNECPWLSWKANSCPDLIERSLKQLRDLIPELPLWSPGKLPRRLPRQVFMPLPGCGNGNLLPTDVYPMIDSTLGNDGRVTLVLRKGISLHDISGEEM